jgi:hypothetical protein
LSLTTISSPGPQTAPRNAGAGPMSIGGPPETETLSSRAPSEKPIQRESGEKNGLCPQ